jgi:hypothetical protein
MKILADHSTAGGELARGRTGGSDGARTIGTPERNTFMVAIGFAWRYTSAMKLQHAFLFWARQKAGNVWNRDI